MTPSGGDRGVKAGSLPRGAAQPPTLEVARPRPATASASFTAAELMRSHLVDILSGLDLEPRPSGEATLSKLLLVQPQATGLGAPIPALTARIVPVAAKPCSPRA